MSAYPRRIGLTGGVGTGKSTVSRYLAQNYQVPILDADLYAREAVEPRSPILAEIFGRYGYRVQMPDETLDRKALGEIIFHDPQEKRWLEGKIHPYVRYCFDRELNQITANTVVLVIPLLFEAKMTDLVTEVWVVRCSWQEQIQRVMKRDHLDEQQAIARINNQYPLESKVAAADVILDNSSLDTLYKQIDAAWKSS